MIGETSEWLKAANAAINEFNLDFGTYYNLEDFGEITPKIIKLFLQLLGFIAIWAIFQWHGLSKKFEM